jgi:hypothetical protein
VDRTLQTCRSDWSFALIRPSGWRPRRHRLFDLSESRLDQHRADVRTDRRLGARLSRPPAPSAIPTTAEQAAGQAVCLCMASPGVIPRTCFVTVNR